MARRAGACARPHPVRAPGRFSTPEEFANIIIRSAGEGGEVRIRDIGRVELGNHATHTTRGGRRRRRLVWRERVQIGTEVEHLAL
jgi:hypothetical protein